MKNSLWTEYDLKKRDEVAANAAHSIASSKHPRDMVNLCMRALLKYEILPNIVWDGMSDDEIREFATFKISPPRRLSEAVDFEYFNKFPSLSVKQCAMLLIDVKPGTPIRTQAKKDKYDRVIRLAASYHTDKREPFANNYVGDIQNYQISPYLFVEWAKLIDEKPPPDWDPIQALNKFHRSEVKMVEAGNSPATTAEPISFYPVADGIRWVIGCRGSIKEIGQVKGFNDIQLALRSPGKNVLGAIAPHAFTPTFSEQKAMDPQMENQIESQKADLTESIRIARKEGLHDELERYEAELLVLNESRPDSRERLNTGDPMISLTSSIRSRRKTAISKIRKELGNDIAGYFETYKVGNRHVIYSPPEPKPKWILDPPISHPR